MNKIIDPNNLTKEQQFIELIKCRKSFYYWVMNYAHISLASGEIIRIGESEAWTKPKSIYRAAAKLVDKFSYFVIDGSRQNFKTTLQLLVLAHRLLFYPSAKLTFLTIDKTRVYDAIERVNATLQNVPKWMQVKNKSKSEKLTYIALENNAKLLTFTVSGNKKAEDVARGISTYTISIDEAAFIRDYDIIHTSMMPAFSTAATAAKKFQLHPTVIVSSTPNGTHNEFYNLLQNSVKIEDIYNFETGELVPNYEEILHAPGRNGFIHVRFFWKHNYDEKWYQEQCRLLNNNISRIRQEIDCVYLGSSDSVFSDEVIEQMNPQPKFDEIDVIYTKFSLYKRIPQNTPLILGIDTAGTNNTKSDFSAIVLTNAITKEPIGELKWKNAILKRYAYLIDMLVRNLIERYNVNPDLLFLAIENNSYGKSVIEDLLFNYDDIPYADMIIMTPERSDISEEKLKRGGKRKKPKKQSDIEWKYGINTNARTRETMMTLLLNQVNTHPESIILPILSDELKSLEQKTNGRIEASKNAHDDVVMAYCFTLYGRSILIEQNRLYIDRELMNKIDEPSDISKLEINPNIFSQKKVQELEESINTVMDFLNINNIDENGNWNTDVFDGIGGIV